MINVLHMLAHPYDVYLVNTCDLKHSPSIFHSAQDSGYTFSIAYRWFATIQLSISTEYKNYFEQQKHLITEDNKNAVFMKCYLSPSSA